MQVTDASVMNAYLAGNKEAFNILYERYSGMVEVLIKKFTAKAHQQEVDDICQQFWLNLVQYGSSYDGTSDVSKWLGVIAYNTTVAYQDKHSPKRTLSVAADEAHSERMENNDPTAAIMLADEIEAVRAAMDLVNPVYRNILEGIYFQDQTPREYADANDIPIGTVYTQLERAVVHVRHKLQPYNGDVLVRA
ncbi:MAG: RNA polymerase sigma factor [Planctomycetota bacterium]|jgi:RNA polymerase sigma factor (sigma-70 family)